MSDNVDDVETRVRDSLSMLASRAYAAAHGQPVSAESRGVRWRLEPRAAISLALVLAVAGAMVTFALRPDTLAALPEPIAALTSLSAVTVHVTGAVASPGVVDLPAGARVAEAVDAVGGLRADADEAAINLARQVRDGEQIYIPVIGEAGSGLINVNRASAGDLERLPGIGPVLAARIVADREAFGPFGSLDDLARVSGIGASVIGQLAAVATV